MSWRQRTGWRYSKSRRRSNGWRRSNNGRRSINRCRRMRAARRRALRSASENLLQAIAKSLGLFGSLRRALVSHIDEEIRRASLERSRVLFIEHPAFVSLYNPQPWTTAQGFTPSQSRAAEHTKVDSQTPYRKE